MVGEEAIETVRSSEAVVAVLSVQNQMVEFGQNARKAGPKIEAPEIERAKLVIIKLLVLDGERTIKRLRKSRRIGDPSRRGDQDVGLLAIPHQRDVRSVVKWR